MLHTHIHVNVWLLTWVSFRHAEVMKKIIETVAEGGGELGVHMYPFTVRKCSSCGCHKRLLMLKPVCIHCFVFLNWNFQVSSDFPQVCAGCHSHNRIRLHKTLHYVASSAFAGAISDDICSDYNRFVLLWDAFVWGNIKEPFFCVCPVHRLIYCARLG